MPDNTPKTPDFSGLSPVEMAAVIGDLQSQLKQRDETLQRRDNYIAILEELLRHKKIQQFAASSEKQPRQILLFDEAELEVEIDALRTNSLTMWKKPMRRLAPASAANAASPTRSCVSVLN